MYKTVTQACVTHSRRQTGVEFLSETWFKKEKLGFSDGTAVNLNEARAL